MALRLCLLQSSRCLSKSVQPQVVSSLFCKSAVFPACTQLQRNFSSATSTGDRAYHWIDAEAEDLIVRAYNRHKAVSQVGREHWPPALSKAELESLGEEVHYTPQNFRDKVAAVLVNGFLEKLMHLFFREKYDHHACVLETVAAVPGVVGAFHRHFRSLRNMKRDHGWINPMQEESENERMHLLIWMKVTKPTRFERTFVLFFSVYVPVIVHHFVLGVSVYGPPDCRLLGRMRCPGIQRLPTCDRYRGHCERPRPEYRQTLLQAAR